MIPTYRRAASLEQCLRGLQAQLRAADEVIVVMQPDDEETLRLLRRLEGWKPLRLIRHSGGGAVGQYNAGLKACEGDIIAITDDDAVPRPEWLQQIESYFATNPDLGGLGGRDVVQEDGVLLEGNANTVGTVQWFGRVIGNHHIGTRLNPSVDVLKGVNMSFRLSAIGDLVFDRDLRGQGAQTCLDMAFSMGVKRRGWRLLYDPEVAVDHFPAKRFDADQRKAPSLQAKEDNAHNFYLTIRRYMEPGWRKRMALLWAFLIGTKSVPGLLRGLAARDVLGIEARGAARRAWNAAKHTAASEYKGAMPD